MDFKVSNDSKEPVSADKGRQNMLLVVLLILVAAFAYLYFFTGLIKPQEAQKPAEAPAPQVVKMPLPPRDGQQPAAAEPAGAPGSKKNAAASAKPEPRKVASAETPEEPQQAESAKPSKAAPPEKKSAATEKKSAATEKKPAATEKKTSAPEKKGAAPETKGVKTTTAAKQQPAAAVKKPVPAQGPAEAAKAPAKTPASAATGPAKKSAPVAAKKDAMKAAPAKARGPWTIVVGNYVLEEVMAKDLARVKGAGLEAAVKPQGRKKTAMNRLLAGEYPSRAEAQAELATLGRYTSDAFVLEQGGKFAVYAGSYLLTDRADSEKERLAAAGIKLTTQHAQVAIPSKSLTAGTFSDKKAADAALKKLKGIGFKATLSHP